MERLLRKVVLRKGVIEIMKKAYVKPELYFENFELSTSIAACAYNDPGSTNQASKNSCGWYDGAYYVFLDGVQGCTYYEDDGYSGICYHGFANNIFGS